MAYSIEIDASGKVLTCALSGPMSYADYKQAFDERLERSTGSDICVWVNDYSDDVVVADISIDDIKLHLQLTRETAALMPELTVISIMPDLLAYGLKRAWQGMGGDLLPWKSYIVRTQEEADFLVRQLLSEEH